MGKLDQTRILVTGGAGFLGSEVVRQLHDLNANLTVIDNLSSGRMKYINEFDDVRLIKCDICDEDAVSEAVKDHEMVVHLAALPFIPDCYFNPEEFFKVNAMGSVNVMWKSIQSETVYKFVHVSSSEVYGTAKYVPMDEQHPTLPHSTYAASKLAADRAVFTLHKEHGFPTVIIRPFNSFGPNVTQPYIIPEIALQLLSKNDHVRLGNVKSSRDFTYVTDTARGIVAALTCKKAIGETINLGSGRETRISELVRLMARVLNRKVEIIHDNLRLRPYDVKRLLCDYGKAQKVLGWRPRIPLEKGLKRTIDWIASNPMEFRAPFKGWYQISYRRQRSERR